MRLILALLWACVLSFTGQYVAAEVFVVTSIGLAISTFDIGVDHKGAITSNCITYTTSVTRTYTRTKTSATSTSTRADSASFTTSTATLSISFGSTGPSNAASSSTRSGIDIGTPLTTAGIDTEIDSEINNSIETSTPIGSTTEIHTASYTEVGTLSGTTIPLVSTVSGAPSPLESSTATTTIPSTVGNYGNTSTILAVVTTTSTEQSGSTGTTGDLIIVIDANDSTNPVSVVFPTTPIDQSQTSPSISTATGGAYDTSTITSTDALPLITTSSTMNTMTEGAIAPTSNALDSAANASFYGEIMTTITDEGGNVIIVPHTAPPITAIPFSEIITTTDSESDVATAIWQILPSVEISSSMSAISSEFRSLLPSFSSWEVYPEPPIQTSITNGVERVEQRIKDLVGKLGGKHLPKCPKNKRGLFDSLFDIAADAIDTIISALNCITSNTENLKKEINDKDTEAVKDLLPKLISLDVKPTSSTTSSSSLSSCTSTTAHHVTISCGPTIITSVEPTIETVACSPQATVTITGCSATDTTTTITSTPTATQTACGQGSCGGGACPLGNGGWVTISPIDCAKIPTITIGGLPSISNRPDHRLPPRVSRRVYIKPTNENTVDPLPFLPPHGTDLTEHLNDLAKRLSTERQWLSHKEGDTTGKWYPFANEKTVAGVTGLFGCTSLIIVSKHGVYLSHIYEDPVFVQKTKLGFLRPTPDKTFQKASFDALVNGDPESGELQPLSSLIGTTETPGPLHYTLQPKIFVVTPFKHGGIGPLMYAKRIEWLSGQLHNYLYPTGSEQHDQKPEMVPYKIAPQYLAENPESLSGKIIMEATQLDHYEQTEDQLFAIGRARLWVNGKEAVTWEFSSQDSISAVGHGLHVLMARDWICPVSILLSSPAFTTFATTTKPTSDVSTVASSTTTSSPPLTSTMASATTMATGALPLPSDASLIGKPQCYEHSDSYPTEIDPSSVQALSEKCFDSTAISIDDLSLGGSGDSKYISWTVNNYFAEIKFDPRCKGPAQNPQYPMEGYDCGSIIKENFSLKSCVTKNGFGGSLKVGCLVYNSYVNNGD